MKMNFFENANKFFNQKNFCRISVTINEENPT